LLTLWVLPEYICTTTYQATGPGLPFSKKSVSAAVLDSVIVFKLTKD